MGEWVNRRISKWEKVKRTGSVSVWTWLKESAISSPFITANNVIKEDLGVRKSNIYILLVDWDGAAVTHRNTAHDRALVYTSRKHTHGHAYILT